jgi:hypothetical protein
VVLGEAGQGSRRPRADGVRAVSEVAGLGAHATRFRASSGVRGRLVRQAVVLPQHDAVATRDGDVVRDATWCRRARGVARHPGTKREIRDLRAA